MLTSLFARLGMTWALQAQAEATLKDLEDWLAKLAVSDYRFTVDQREFIEKLFTPHIESQYSKDVQRAWYKAARAALPIAIKARRDYLKEIVTPSQKTKENEDASKNT